MGPPSRPFGANSYYSVSHEAARQTVNNVDANRNTLWLMAVIDFDALVRDPRPTQINLLTRL